MICIREIRMKEQSFPDNPNLPEAMNYVE